MRTLVLAAALLAVGPITACASSDAALQRSAADPGVVAPSAPPATTVLARDFDPASIAPPAPAGAGHDHHAHHGHGAPAEATGHDGHAGHGPQESTPEGGHAREGEVGKPPPPPSSATTPPSPSNAPPSRPAPAPEHQHH